MSAPDVVAVMDAIQQRLDASFGMHSFPEYAEARAAVAELIEAAKKVRMGRHTHTGIGAPDSESCGLCKHNWRHEIHFRVGESHPNDLMALDAALARVGGAK